MTVQTLKNLLEHELDQNDELPEDINHVVVNPNSQHTDSHASCYTELGAYEGDVGYGGESLPAFYAWTEDYVYFKSVYDGAERASSVPRNLTENAPKSIR